MILVTGATGGLGKATINALSGIVPVNEIVGLARDLTKAAELTDKGIEVRQGDYLDYDSLLDAFKGIDKVVLISAPVFTHRETQHRNVINAAKATGVKYIIYTGIQTNPGSNWVVPMVTESDADTMQALKASGITYTYVRNTIYADVLGFLLGADVLEAGVSFPSGEGRLAYATRRDLGEGLARLVTAGGYDNQEITFSNSESWSSADIATILSEVSGKTVPFLNSNKADYVAHQQELGIPAMYADFASDWAAATKAGEFEQPDPTLEKLLGRKPTSII
jgi:NAD(P)H dehydrogenase (quinone)